MHRVFGYVLTCLFVQVYLHTIFSQADIFYGPLKATNTGLHEHFIEGLLVQQAFCREGPSCFPIITICVGRSLVLVTADSCRAEQLQPSVRDCAVF